MYVLYNTYCTVLYCTVVDSNDNKLQDYFMEPFENSLVRKPVWHQKYGSTFIGMLGRQQKDWL